MDPTDEPASMREAETVTVDESSDRAESVDSAESIVHALGDGAYVLDADRNRVFVNDRLREVTDRP